MSFSEIGSKFGYQTFIIFVKSSLLGGTIITFLQETPIFPPATKERHFLIHMNSTFFGVNLYNKQ
jgi:hypothetical protein